MTNKHLAGYRVRSQFAADVFANQRPEYKIEFSIPSSSWRGPVKIQERGRPTTSVLLEYDGQTQVCLPGAPKARGRYAIPEIRLSSTAPAGLLFCWRYFKSDDYFFVYPNPVDHGCSHAEFQNANRYWQNPDVGEFAGHSAFRVGDRLSQVDWKAVARGRSWQIKNFSSSAPPPILLAWHQTGELGDFEKRLEQICFWLTQLPEAQPVVLDLPNGEKVSDRVAALRALAMAGES